MSFNSLSGKIIVAVLLLVILAFSFVLLKIIKDEEAALLRGKEVASEQLAEPVIHAIYRDMLVGRAEMARFMIEGMKKIDGIERFQVVRENGVEEAFMDLKTLKKVEARIGSLEDDWTFEHPDVAENVAAGVDNEEFKKYFDEFKDGRIEGAHYYEEVSGARLMTYLSPIELRSGCLGCHEAGESFRGVLMISLSLDEAYATLGLNKTLWFAYGFVALLCVSVVLAFILRRIVTRPITQTLTMVSEIAEGGGDLTRRLEATSDDEVGRLERSFNVFIEGLQKMIGDIASTSADLAEAAESIKGVSRGLYGYASAQSEAAEEALSSVHEMDASIKEVADNAETLLLSAEGSSASTLEMSATVSEVAESTHKLAIAAGDTASAISEIAASLKQVANYVDTLLTETEQVGSATAEIDSTIKQVAALSMQQAQLAERVKDEALSIGIGAVDKTRQGIEKIKDEVASTAAVVDRLGQMSSEIGKIVGVIDEVADTTNLLAFNATILAAQAGEHGKGFAVVADEVKDLSDRTTASTKEIGELIRQVRSEVEVAVSSMETSRTSVEEGMGLSRDASDALGKIVKSAEDSVDMARRVEKATEEQARGISIVAESIFRITGMVEEIKKATDEQSRASDGISASTEKVKDSTIHMEQSSLAQSKELKHLSGVIMDVAVKMNAISGATAEQREASMNIVTKCKMIKEHTELSVSSASDLDGTVKKLNENSAALKDKVSRFKV